MYIGDDTARIDMLAHTYSMFKFPDEPDLIPNPAPHIFPEWGGNCQATKAGLYNEPSPFQIANPTNVITVDAHERRRYHVAHSSSRNIPELCREFLTVSSIFKMAKVWTSCSAAVSFFIGETISGNIRFKESLHRRRERVRVTAVIDSILVPTSVVGGVDVEWVKFASRINEKLGSADAKVASAVSASELAVRLATLGPSYCCTQRR